MSVKLATVAANRRAFRVIVERGTNREMIGTLVFVANDQTALVSGVHHRDPNRSASKRAPF